MSDEKTSLKAIKAQYSPDENPLMKSVVVPVKKSRVRSGLAEIPLIDGDSGQLVATSVIHQITDTDADEFVKVFASGIAAAYELSRAGQRVFQSVLGEYEKAPMSGGFVDSVYLAWFDGGLSGRDIGMSDRTFARGLRELLEKSFLAPREPNVYWVNPALFFKGDRVRFVREYQRAPRVTSRPPVATITRTAHVVAPVGGASRPRQPAPLMHVDRHEPTKPHHAPAQPAAPVGGFRFGKKKKRSK